MKKPLVSVLMPAYNAEKYIGEAIESILSQTYKNFEFIIVDDASTDNNTWKIIQKYAKKDKRIRAFKNKANLNISLTLNKAISHAKGKYFARMDNDDISLPERISTQVELLEEKTKVGIVGGYMEIVDPSSQKVGIRKYPQTDKDIRKNIYRFSPFSHPTIMMRADIIKKIGGYNPIYVYANDYDLYFRIGAISEFRNLPKILIKYRVVENSMTTGSSQKMEKETLIVRKKYSNQGDYTMTFFDKLYNLLQKISLYIIPNSIRIALFNYWRSL